MTWREASALARQGARIRRIGWLDRWITRGVALWYLTPVALGTLRESARRVVQATDWSPAEFLATDWTTDPMPGFAFEPSELLIQSSGYQDDDLRIVVDGVTVSDTRQNVAWYFGETILGPGGNPSYLTAGFRAIRLSAAAMGNALRVGSVVQVDLFDGWAGSYQSAPWTATLTWPDARTTVHTGGSIKTGSSPLPGTGAPNYYDIGPHFAHYVANGSFTVTSPDA